MRALIVSVLLACAASAAYAQQAPGGVSTVAYVAPAGGLHVREAPRADAPVIATLWQGARVFVRETGEPYARVDGFGVAGSAFVDSRYLSEQAPVVDAVADDAAASAAPATNSR